MADKIEGYLEVGRNDKFEVVLNLDHDRDGTGHIIFSPNQARNLARLLVKQANEAVKERLRALNEWQAANSGPRGPIVSEAPDSKRNT